MRRLAALLRRDRRGSTYVGTILSMAVFLCLLFCFVSILPVITAKLDVDYFARSLVKTIELTGEKGAAYNAELSRLKAETGLDPAVSVTGPFHGTRIQLRERFTVTVRVEVPVKLTDPTFGEGLAVRVPVSKTLRGMSEVYWK